MGARGRMKRITTTIKREWLDKIVDGSKTVEYREAKLYWQHRLHNIEIPFELRLINGMNKRAPEVIVRVDRVELDEHQNEYALYIGRILSIKNFLKVRKDG